MAFAKESFMEGKLASRLYSHSILRFFWHFLISLVLGFAANCEETRRESLLPRHVTKALDILPRFTWGE